MQRPDGGFPETFVCDPRSGCSTTAEVYAALAVNPGVAPECDIVADRAEKYLLGVLERQGDGGLPYYECPAAESPGPRTSHSIVDATAAFLMGWTARHPAEIDVRRRMTAWLEHARSGGPGSAFGIRPGDGSPRTYSTTYALLALGPSEATGKDALALLSWRDPATGAWPFRPGMPPSRLGTALALDALALHRVLPDDVRDAAERWLLARLPDRSFLEEDSFVSPEGYKLSFLYAPRLVAIGQVLRARSAGRVDLTSWSSSARQLLTALAEHTRRIRDTGLPCPELGELRSWHYIELLFGMANLSQAVQALPEPVRKEFEGLDAECWAEVTRVSLATELPVPLRRVARALATRPPSFPEALTHDLATQIEQVCLFVGLLLLAALRRLGEPGVVAVREHFEAEPKGTSTLFALTAAWRKVARSGTASPEPAVIDRIGRELRAVLGSKGFEALKEMRNGDAHGRPIGSPETAVRLRGGWIALLDSIQSLRDLELVTLDRIGHAADSPMHVYQWADLEQRSRRGITWTNATLPDWLQVDGLEMHAVFARDRARPDAVPLSLLPFAATVHCPKCATERLFVYASHKAKVGQDVQIFLRCTEACGTTLQPRIPWHVVLGA